MQIIAFISIRFECGYAERACKVRVLVRANADGWQSGRLRRAVNPFLSLDAQVRILLHLVNIDIKINYAIGIYIVSCCHGGIGIHT